MKISDLEHRLQFLPLIPYRDDNLEAAYTSDLLSDVMANAPENSLLITLQAHKNTVACAALVGIRALVLTGHAGAPPDMLEAAKAENIAVFVSSENQFTVSWKVAQLLGVIAT